MKRTGFICALCLCLGYNAEAQFQGNVFVEDSSVKAYVGTTQQYLAWDGGHNNPQLSMADLDNDGLNDLVIFEWSTAQVKTYINTGSAGNPHYVYMPEYAKNFPPCHDYLIMRDYNEDGIADLFNKGNQGFEVYKGYMDAGTLHFTKYKDLRYNSPTSGSVNAYTQSGDIPGIEDIDGDGDLDFFGYDVNGIVLSFYKNCRVEHGLPADSIEVCYPESCWGKMNQTLYRRYAIGPGVSCPSGTFLFGCKGTLHPGNVMCFADLDGDGDMDFLDGNLSFSDMQMLKNGRIEFGSATDSIVSQDTLWQSVPGGHQLYLPAWPAPHWLDIDNDGDRDLLFSPHAQNISENYKTITLYRNTGSDAAPSFQFETDTFLVEHSIDAGAASAPLFYDYDKDGRPDLVIGSDGFYIGGQKIGQLVLYKNVLQGGVTTFVLQSRNFLSVDTIARSGSRPAIGDLDNDGIDDLVIGHNDGSLSFYHNAAVSNLVQPDWELSQVQLINTFGDTIDAGNTAAPCIYDINKDGHPDLLIGNLGGTVHYYKNLATGTTPALEFETNYLGQLRSNPNNLFSGYASLYIGKMDNTNTDYIVMGTDSGRVRRYTDFQSGNTDTVYTLIDSSYSNLNVGLRSNIAFSDVDGDGMYEMLIGNLMGGLQQFKQVLTVSVNDLSNEQTFGSCQVSPNPAKDHIHVAWTKAFMQQGRVTVILTNVAGQILLRKEVESVFETDIPFSAQLPGTYVVQVVAGRNSYHRKVVKL